LKVDNFTDLLTTPLLSSIHTSAFNGLCLVQKYSSIIRRDCERYSGSYFHCVYSDCFTILQQ